MAEPVGGALSREFRRLYESAGLTQPQVAEVMGIPQSTVSEWARGVSLPRATALPLLERAVGVTVGTILRRAGLVEDNDLDVVAALNADKRLTDTSRRMLTTAYLESVKSSASRATAPKRAPTEAAKSVR